MVADVLSGIPVANESVERLHASAIIEHFYLHELKEKVLPEFYRVLKTGGTLYIVVPDWQKIKKAKNWEMIQQNLYGAYHDYIPIQYDIHKYCWDYLHLKEILEEFGFKNVREVKYEGHHGAEWSLAVEAEK